MEGLGSFGPRSADVCDNTFKVADSQICHLKNSKSITPATFWVFFFKNVINQSSEHDITDQKDFHSQIILALVDGYRDPFLVVKSASKAAILDCDALKLYNLVVTLI